MIIHTEWTTVMTKLRNHNSGKIGGNISDSHDNTDKTLKKTKLNQLQF